MASQGDGPLSNGNNINYADCKSGGFACSPEFHLVTSAGVLAEFDGLAPVLALGFVSKYGNPSNGGAFSLDYFKTKQTPAWMFSVHFFFMISLEGGLVFL